MINQIFPVYFKKKRGGDTFAMHECMRKEKVVLCKCQNSFSLITFVALQVNTC